MTKQTETATETKQDSDDLTLKDLNQYYGTEQYHNVMGVNVTDGINYIIQNGYSWFVTDFISLVKHESIKEQEFLSIKLKLNTHGNKTALMEITDGNENILYTQRYDYTNAKRELNLYFINEVLLLSGEY